MRGWNWLLVGLAIGIGASALLYHQARAGWLREADRILTQAAADSARHVADSIALETSHQVVDSLTQAAAASARSAEASSRRANQAAATTARLRTELAVATSAADTIGALAAIVASQSEEIVELRSTAEDWRAGFQRQQAATARLEADLARARADAERLAATNADLRRTIEAAVPPVGFRFPLGTVGKVLGVAGLVCLAAC